MFNARYLAATAQLDRQLGQARLLALWVETEGMVPLVSAIAHEFSLPLLSGAGFDSNTSKMAFADRVAAARRPVTILHVGDLDHSGDTIWRSLIEDLTAMSLHLGGELEIVRIACLDHHIDELGLDYVEVDSGMADGGSNHGAHFTGTRECQAEAIDPEEADGLWWDQLAHWHHRAQVILYIDEMTAAARTGQDRVYRRYTAAIPWRASGMKRGKSTLDSNAVRYIDNLLAQPA